MKHEWVGISGGMVMGEMYGVVQCMKCGVTRTMHEVRDRCFDYSCRPSEEGKLARVAFEKRKEEAALLERHEWAMREEAHQERVRKAKEWEAQVTEALK